MFSNRAPGFSTRDQSQKYNFFSFRTADEYHTVREIRFDTIFDVPGLDHAVLVCWR